MNAIPNIKKKTTANKIQFILGLSYVANCWEFIANFGFFDFIKNNIGIEKVFNPINKNDAAIAYPAL